MPVAGTRRGPYRLTQTQKSGHRFTMPSACLLTLPASSTTAREPDVTLRQPCPAAPPAAFARRDARALRANAWSQRGVGDVVASLPAPPPVRGQESGR
jgi:hypothetical protein